MYMNVMDSDSLVGGLVETFSPECFQIDCSHHPGLSRGIEAGLELGGGLLAKYL